MSDTTYTTTVSQEEYDRLLAVLNDPTPKPIPALVELLKDTAKDKED